MGININLKSEDAESIDRLVASGRYASLDEVIREGIRLVGRRDEWLADVEAKVAEGRAQIARGEGMPLEEAFDRLERRFADR